MILLTGKIQPKLRISGYKLISLFILLTWILNACQPRWEIDNPYESVDWAVFTPHKANFHTHTTRSDGRMNPQSVVDKYHSYGYTILALTDHNEVTWPWTKFSEMSTSNRSRQRLAGGQLTPADTTYEDRQPEMLGMLAIQGNELSRHHHMGSFFNDHNGTVTEEESLVSTAAKNGITTFMHPGRYKFPTEWYTDFYKRYPHLVGLEIYNQGDRYPNDRQLWDSILTVLMPDRKVWGFSNDDMHGESALGRNWSVILLPELKEEWVRKSMVNGHFYYVYAPDGHEGPKPPEITSIAVKPGKATIEISTVSCDSVRWISEGRIIHRGNLIKLKNHPEIGGYVRAELYGQGKSVAGTQPFGLRKRK
jgi:hypothetical protein